MTGLDELAAKYEAAYNAQDPAGVAALYARHARWTTGGGAVFIGRESIETALAGFMGLIPPHLSFQEKARVASGRYAVSRGVYRLTGPVDGQERSIGGAYLNVLRDDRDGWRIITQQLNYDVPMIPAMWVGDRSVFEDLATKGSLLSQLAFGPADLDRDGGANVWAPDAQVSLPGAGWVSGPTSIRRALQASSEHDVGVVMHDLETLLLDGGLAVDMGWYELGAPQRPAARWGTYTLLARWVPRGEWLLHWLVATTSPE